MSDIVVALLLVAMVVGLGMVVLAFASGSIATAAGGFSGLISNGGNAASERFVVEDASYAFTGGTSYGPLALDGSGSNDLAGASSSISSTLSTSTGGDVLVAFVSPADSGAVPPPSVSSLSGGGLTWAHRATTPSQTYTANYYVPITLTNSQSSATPNPFQQEVTWNPSAYSSYEASDLGNIRFCADSGCSVPLRAWLESCGGSATCSPAATSATAWVRLVSSIPSGGGSLVIYMAFEGTSTEFDGVYWGEAPQLSGVYARYDNGGGVFSAYFDGNTPVSSFSVYGGYSLAQATGVTGPGGNTINALEATGYNGGNPVFAFSTALGNLGVVVESSFSSPGSTTTSPYTGTDTGAAGLVDNGAVSLVSNGISANMGYGVSFFNQDYESGGAFTADQNAAGTATAGWVYATLTYPGPTSSSWSASIAPQLYSSAGGYAGTLNNNPLNSATNLYMGQLSDTAAGYQLAVYYNFMRARAYPPNDVMPSVSAGGLSSVSESYDLEEWYATAPTALSSATITASLSTSDTASTWLAVFAVSGANATAPFDPCTGCSGGTAPQTAVGASNVQTAMSTSNANDILLFGCAAQNGAVPTGFTTVYSQGHGPSQGELVGYRTVSSTESGLVTSCGGTDVYGAQISDALRASKSSSHAGADLYVRNVGNVPVTIASVYVFDSSTNSMVGQFQVGRTLPVGGLVDINASTLSFTPYRGEAYLFKVTSSLGNAATFNGVAA